jgi:GntR family transcriptional regulator
MPTKKPQAIEPPGNDVSDSRLPPFFWADNRIIEHVSAIGPYGFSVYMLLASYAGDKRTCFPSVPTLAELLGCTQPTIRKAIKALKDAGLIKVTPRRTEKGDPTSHLYELLPVPGVLNVVEGGTKSGIGGVLNVVSPNKNQLEPEPTEPEPATQGEAAPHVPPIQAEAPTIDPLFAFEAQQQHLDPVKAQADKKTKGWIYSLVSDFVNGEKRLLKVATLSKDQRSALAKELPGFVRWYKEQCEGCSYPADVATHARWVMRWYEAGKPYARVHTPPKFDPNCPECKGSGLVDMWFNPKTSELIPRSEKRGNAPGWELNTRYCTCRLLGGV